MMIILKVFSVPRPSIAILKFATVSKIVNFYGMQVRFMIFIVLRC